MFYCTECQIRNSWPQSLASSEGNCECCGRHAVCYDVQASKLPPVKPAPLSIVDEFIGNIGEDKVSFSQEEVIELFGRYYQDLFLWTGVDDTEWIRDNIINLKSDSNEE